jgi:hypothetical protein
MENNDLVRQNTPPVINAEIDEKIHEHLNLYYNDPSKIEHRLWELEKEWDIERMLELNAAALSFIGLFRGLTRHKLWFILPVAVVSFLAVHAMEGWCPPIVLLRKLGFRTKAEIEKEKYALKMIRGDFKYLLDLPNVAWNAVNR